MASLANIRSVSYFDYLLPFQRQTVPLIDLRSPVECELGSMPYAVNLPLFTDEERIEVGTLYKQVSKLEAVQRGLEIFAAKAEIFLENLLACTRQNTIALHCKRGGMRSASVATWLASLGVQVLIVEGGYTAYRQQVFRLLDTLGQHPLVVLNGRTGSGKTELLSLLSDDCPYLDFEKLAGHRGSAFGDLNQTSPVATQQNFENRLAEAYLQVRHSPRILVEIENFIGPVALPVRLRRNIIDAPMIILERDFTDRIRRIVAEYCGSWEEKWDAVFEQKMTMFAKHFSQEQRQELIDLVRARRFDDVVARLLKMRYDPLYDRAIKRHSHQVVARFHLPTDLEDARRFVSDYTAARETLCLS